MLKEFEESLKKVKPFQPRTDFDAHVPKQVDARPAFRDTQPYSDAVDCIAVYLFAISGAKSSRTTDHLRECTRPNRYALCDSSC